MSLCTTCNTRNCCCLYCLSVSSIFNLSSRTKQRCFSPRPRLRDKIIWGQWYVISDLASCGWRYLDNESKYGILSTFISFHQISNIPMAIQLGQLSVNPPGLVLEAGGTSALQAWLPAKLKSPPLQAEVWGGSRWTDLAVHLLHSTLHF